MSGARRFLLLYLALRALLLLQPGYPDDLAAYRRWAVTASQKGLASVYRESDMDYPPLYAYLLLPLGHAYTALSPGAGTRQGGNHAIWVALAKLPPLAFDLAIAWLLSVVGRRADRASGAPAAAAVPWRLLLPGAYLANPAVVFDTGYWGHPDSIHGFFVLAAFLLALDGRTAAGFAALAVGTLMKPLAAPFFPLLAALAYARSGLPAIATGGLAAIAAGVLGFLPFLLSGDAAFVVRRVLLDLDAMPYSSVNAHNLWGLFGGWRNAEDPLLGPLSATAIGLSLFGLAYLAILAKAWPWFRAAAPPAGTALAATAVGYSFFMLATHMHENHLFVAIPLLAAALPAGAVWRRFYVAISLALLVNLVLHDPAAGHWPLSLGGQTAVARPSHGRNYFQAELWAVRAATGLGLVLYGTFLYTFMAAPAPDRPEREGRE